MEDQVYLSTTGIQNILHLNQPTRTILKKEKTKQKHTVVDGGEKTLGMSQLSVVQIVLKENPK